MKGCQGCGCVLFLLVLIAGEPGFAEALALLFAALVALVLLVALVQGAVNLTKRAVTSFCFAVSSPWRKLSERQKEQEQVNKLREDLLESGRLRALERLRSKSACDREAAALALAHWPNSASVKPLLRALFDSSPHVREAAATSLGLFGMLGQPAMKALRLKSKRDSVWEVRQAANKALQMIEAVLELAPGELIAAQSPEGKGTELHSARKPQGGG